MKIIRMLSGLLGLVMLASSCAVTPEMASVLAESPGESASELGAVVPDNPDADPVLYCQAIDWAFAISPSGAVSESEFAAYADALERAAGFATPAHQVILVELAEVNRDPSKMTAEKAAALFPRSAQLMAHADEECGVSPPGVTVNEDGSFSTSSSIEFETSSGPIDITSPPGDDDSEPQRVIPTGSSTEPARKLPGGDERAIADAINARVPEGVDLVFSWDTVSDDDDGENPIRSLVPTGWSRSGFLGVDYSSPAFDSQTELMLKAGCQGGCQPQDWNANVFLDPESSPFAYWTNDDITLMLDQPLNGPSGRLMVVREIDPFGGDESVEVVLVRYSDEADRFLWCEARLVDADIDLWPIFADVCLAASADWL